MIKKILELLGYSLTRERFNYPIVDGTFAKQTKFAFEIFFNPLQITLQYRVRGVGKTTNIQKDTKDEYSID